MHRFRQCRAAITVSPFLCSKWVFRRIATTWDPLMSKWKKIGLIPTIINKWLPQIQTIRLFRKWSLSCNDIRPLLAMCKGKRLLSNLSSSSHSSSLNSITHRFLPLTRLLLSRAKGKGGVWKEICTSKNRCPYIRIELS